MSGSHGWGLDRPWKSPLIGPMLSCRSPYARCISCSNKHPHHLQSHSVYVMDKAGNDNRANQLNPNNPNFQVTSACLKCLSGGNAV
jgi:hypothetical protein